MLRQMYFIILLLQHQKDFLVEYSSDVEDWALGSSLLSRKDILQAFELRACQTCPVLSRERHEIVECNLTLVINIRFLPQFAKKLLPFPSDLSAHLLNVLDSLIGVHLQMDLTVVLVIFHGLKALGVVTAYDVALERLVLSEVEALLRKHLRSD